MEGCCDAAGVRSGWRILTYFRVVGYNSSLLEWNSSIRNSWGCGIGEFRESTS